MPKISKSDAEWMKQLTAEQYRVTRKQGTEPPYTGEYLENHEKGTYKCVCCGAPLFTSDTKFESHCGWPSFYETLGNGMVEEQTDLSHGMRRVEVHCKECGAHLGHVFEDGPNPTGLRYCINSVSLTFDKAK